MTEILSNAKINLALRITNRLENGYHSISTIFQEIDLHDTLTFRAAAAFDFSSNDITLPTDEGNLCVAAYQKMVAVDGEKQPFAIYLEKTIPMGAGLGGGSSNAAAVLRFLNKAWQLDLRYEQLAEIALSLGCDVPFFLNGGCQEGNGLGEILSPIDIASDYTLLLVCPDVHISTPWAYKQFDLTKKKRDYKFGSFVNAKEFLQLFENQFETVVFPSYPEIGAIKKNLLQSGAIFASLSGSGSTVFGVFEEEKQAIAAKQKFSAYSTHVSHPIIRK